MLFGFKVFPLGTTFNISAYPNEEYQTTLVNGSVRVSAEKANDIKGKVHSMADEAKK